MNKQYNNLKIRKFLKGDYVMSTQGVGIVVNDEDDIKTIEDLYFREILIKHNFGISSNPSNDPILVHRSILIRITKKEYLEDCKIQDKNSEILSLLVKKISK